MQHDLGVEQPVPLPQRCADDDHRQQVRRRRRQFGDSAVHQRRLLTRQVVDGVTGERQLREQRAATPSAEHCRGALLLGVMGSVVFLFRAELGLLAAQSPFGARDGNAFACPGASEIASVPVGPPSPVRFTEPVLRDGGVVQLARWSAWYVGVPADGSSCGQLATLAGGEATYLRWWLS